MWKLATCALAVYLAGSCAAADSPRGKPDPADVLATVGDEAVTEADFQLFCAVRNISPEQQAEHRSKLLENLVERRLIRRFLRQRKIAPDAEELAAHRLRVDDLIRRRGDEPEALLKRLGLTDETLNDELGLPLAWKAYLRVAVTDERIDAYFSKHRAELDGTKLRAAQIILKLKPDAPPKEIERRQARLAALRKDVLAKKLSFADAARKYSEAPSKDKGGDVGWFSFRGKMPAAFCDAAFALQPGEISEPVVTPFGVHLIQVTDRQPGELTLEDVRTEIVERISQELWADAVAKERAATKVVILKKSS